MDFRALWMQTLFGPDQLFWAGAATALTVTYFTFLPSFLFILAGGPLVESTHGNLKFTAPLTAITATTVGVILKIWPLFLPTMCSGRKDFQAVSMQLRL